MPPLLLLHRRYERTCRICGDRWTVTRRQARPSPGRMRRPAAKGVRRAGTATGTGWDFAGASSAYTAAVEVWQAFRRCPHCGIDDFTQRPGPAPVPRP